MRETDKRAVVIRIRVREIALPDAAVDGIVALVYVVNVFGKIVDKEIDVRLVKVFGWLRDVVRLVRLRFKRRVLLSEEVCAECALCERLLCGEHILDESMRAADCA